MESVYENDETVNELSLSDLANLFFATRPKDRDYYVELFDNLKNISAQESTVKELCKSLKQVNLLRQLSMDAYSASEGDSKALQKSLESLQNLQQLEESHQKNDGEEFSFVTDDLDSLVNSQVLKPGLRWRLDSLNKSLGSLRKGDFGFVFARPESFARDTEVLTPTGWITVDKVTLDTEIAQVDEYRHISFTKPLGVYPHEQEECVRIHDTLGRVDLLVTKGHAMVYEQHGKLHKERAEDILYYQNRKHHTAGFIKGNRKLSFYERFLIAYQADGYSKFYQNKNGVWVGFLKFKKERKIKRLKWILDNLECEWAAYSKDKKNQVEFRVVLSDKIYKEFGWVNLADIDATWGHEFLQELSHWDGSIRTATRFKYDTTNKECVDMVQAIAALSGYNAFLSVREDTRKESYSDVYTLHLRSAYVPIDGQCIKKEIISFNDTTYCFKVPTGMLLVRRNGATAICGNTGKTTFLCSEGSYMAEQDIDNEGPILHLNNEEQGEKVMLRYYQASLGYTMEQLYGNLNNAKQAFKSRTQGRILLYDSASISAKQVERLVEQVKPRLIVCDQLAKIQGFEADRKDLELGAKFQWARELAKEYAPFIAAHQADGTGENQKWLSMANVADVKTAVQAEADWILGIGKIHDAGYETLRFLNVSKNKLVGDPDTDPNLRHGRWEVLIDPLKARYLDLDYGN